MQSSMQKKIYLAVVGSLGITGLAPINAFAAPAISGFTLLPPSLTPANSLTNTAVTVQATAGDANIISDTGQVNITGATTVTLQGNSQATVFATNGDASLEAAGGGNANITGDTDVNITATNGNATVNAANGTAAISGGIANMTATTGAANFTGQTGANITATTGNTNVTAATGNANVIGETGVTAAAINGTATFGALFGDASVIAGNDASVNAGNNINLSAGNDAAINVDANNGGSGRFVVNDFNNATGGRVDVLTADADDGVTGNLTDGTRTSTWTFDENGFVENTTDGTSTNTTTRTALGQNRVVTSGANTSQINQTATNQTHRVAAGGNSNTSTRTVASTTNTVIGVGGTTSSFQDDRDWISSTGLGAGSARVAVQRSSGAATAELSVTNSAGNTHGVFVGENNTRVSGGTNSTSLTFDDAGAHFRNDSTGGPARVTGVADGIADFDAVNVRQLNHLDKKLTNKINETGAIGAAFAQLGQSQTPGKSTFGIAAGGQGNKAGIALGFSHRPVNMKPVVFKGSLGASGKTVAGGVGATWEF